MVYRVIGKEFSDPTVMRGVEGRWNSIGTEVLYSSRNRETAILEFQKHNPGVEFKVFEIKLKPKISLETDVLLGDDKISISRAIGDVVKNSSGSTHQAMIVKSVENGKDNIIIMSKEIIENYKQVQ